ncbi:MAG TPA: hypothetical protein PKU69_02610, partial [Bacillota bacterium]|nr:hypothetical protein [Bacillota bacterium]
YLITYVLPYVEAHQNLYFHRKVTEKISEILNSKKRYKDAGIYHQKHIDFKENLTRTVSV